MFGQTSYFFDTAHRVLYIAGNVGNVRLVDRVVSRRPGLLLDPVLGGIPGLAQARGERPAVVLLDRELPDIHGDDLLMLLRAGPQTRSIPVVIISSVAVDRQIQVLLEAGASAYLTKPLDSKRLLDTIDELVERP